MNKLNNEELNTLNTLTNDYNSILNSIGILEIRKNKLFYQHQGLQEEFEKFSKILKDKYGDGIIDLKTGEIKLEEVK